MDIDNQIRSIEDRLTVLEQERTSLLGELRSLRSQKDNHAPATPLGRAALMKSPETNEEKAELFLSLFRGRESLYPKRWENN